MSYAILCPPIAWKYVNLLITSNEIQYVIFHFFVNQIAIWIFTCMEKVHLTFAQRMQGKENCFHECVFYNKQHRLSLFQLIIIAFKI